MGLEQWRFAYPTVAEQSEDIPLQKSIADIDN